MKRALACVSLVLCGACASDPPPVAPPSPALLAVELMRGFDLQSGPSTPPHVVALIDAGKAMSARDAQNVTRWSAARSAAQRWLGALPETTQIDLWAVAGTRDAVCATPARNLGRDDGTAREGLFAAFERLDPAGEGSLAEALIALANALPDDPTPTRVVAFSALADGCGGSLCDAARALSARGARLDLVVLGDAEAPPCLSELELEPQLYTPPPARPAVGFRVERLDDEPAVLACSDAGGLPVVLPGGRARVRVALDPPLVVETSVAPGSRLVLEIVDFPALDAGSRQWRWRERESQAPRPKAAEAP